jgi:hypothetical protein
VCQRRFRVGRLSPERTPIRGRVFRNAEGPRRRCIPKLGGSPPEVYSERQQGRGRGVSRNSVPSSGGLRPPRRCSRPCVRPARTRAGRSTPEEGRSSVVSGGSVIKGEASRAAWRRTCKRSRLDTGPLAAARPAPRLRRGGPPTGRRDALARPSRWRARPPLHALRRRSIKNDTPRRFLMSPTFSAQIRDPEVRRSRPRVFRNLCQRILLI